MRIADYIWSFLANKGATDVFLVTGGNAMHLDDALGLETRIKITCVHHEQAAAMAAEGYARVDGHPGILCVTSGPGAINALGGIYGAFVDSQPVICIAGQSKRELLRSSYDPEQVAGLRQLGVQEADAVAMARPVTKYAATIQEPFLVRYMLEKAWHLATSGRPGPVFLEVPLDVQAMEIDPLLLDGFKPQTIKHRSLTPRCLALIRQIQLAKRPLLLGGEGIREAGAVVEFRQLAALLKIPVVTAWMPDLYPADQPFYAGRIGTLGTRAGNYCLQNADFILALGSRLSVPQTTFNWENFAPRSHVVSVNIDAAELNKPIHAADEIISADPRIFLQEMLMLWKTSESRATDCSKWLAWCKSLTERHPEITHSMRTVSEKGIHPYFFIEELFKRLEDDAFIASGNAASACVAFQAAPLRSEQRLTSNASAGAMGHDLPSAIGAALARQGKKVICLAGDGSIMMNLQELQTIASNRLPIGIFLMNNGGYLSIRTTQKNFFGRYVGESPASGIAFPDFTAVARSFGIQAFTLAGKHFCELLAQIVSTDGPWLCDVHLNPDIGFEPCIVSARRPDGSLVSAQLDNMFPFLVITEQFES